jgi:predicted O-methyltransferase YrrM
VLLHGRLGRYLAYSRLIPGWTRGPEAITLARTSFDLPDNAVIVEIGTFLGGSTVLLAGGRKLRGSGVVHCVDPFDASGEEFSAPIYRDIQERLSRMLRTQFETNIRGAGLDNWVVVHQGTASEVSRIWRQPVDLVFLDGDQSPDGVRLAYDSWAPFLKQDGILAVHNSNDRVYARGHDGHRRLVMEAIRPPEFGDAVCIGTTTFARRQLSRFAEAEHPSLPVDGPPAGAPRAV